MRKRPQDPCPSTAAACPTAPSSPEYHLSCHLSTPFAVPPPPPRKPGRAGGAPRSGLTVGSVLLAVPPDLLGAEPAALPHPEAPQHLVSGQAVRVLHDCARVLRPGASPPVLGVSLAEAGSRLESAAETKKNGRLPPAGERFSAPRERRKRLS